LALIENAAEARFEAASEALRNLTPAQMHQLSRLLRLTLLGQDEI
jgi:hypothetical protein